ncbi:MAG: hypothetical protein COB62_02355 [Piscirickettsiaceae bacterium]|nr:MAG: hypothetical protein COB62_02355 [Piscirickettsiaceae bacterium]
MSLLVLPLQNVLAMTDMGSCDMDMSANSTMSMDMSMCLSDTGDMSTADTASSIDCDDNHCNKCFHGASFILTNAAVINDINAHQQSTVFDSRYLSFYTPLDSPPPIIS